MLEFSPGRTLDETVTLQEQGHAESFVEVMVPLRAGEGIAYTWTASAPVAFNIHAHPEKRVEYFERVQAAGGHGEFRGPRADHFYLMWQNPAEAPVDLQFQVDSRP